MKTREQALMHYFKLNKGILRFSQVLKEGFDPKHLRGLVKKGEVEKMQIGMAQTVFGFIESVLNAIGGERVRQNFVKEKLALIPTENFLAAFMTAAIGCIGGLMPAGFGVTTFSSVSVLGVESNRIHCPNCKKTVSCAIGEACPGCHQVRPC